MLVEVRSGVGEDLGYLLCNGDSSASLLQTIADLQLQLKIRLD